MRSLRGLFLAFGGRGGPGERASGDRVASSLGGETRDNHPGRLAPWKMEKFSIPSDWPGRLRKAPSVMVEVQKGGVWVEVASGLFLRRKVAYLRTPSEDRLDEALEGAKFLRSFLAEIGLSDLEGALETLSQLEEGEIRQEGPYVLARKRDISDIRVLRRGVSLVILSGTGLFWRERSCLFSSPRGWSSPFKATSTRTRWASRGRAPGGEERK